MLTGRLERLAGTFPVFVIAGARQLGRSTLLNHVFGDRADAIVFDPGIDVSNARAGPDLFLDTHPPPIVLDEIQYAPELVAAIKRRVDRQRQPGQYSLTGARQWSVLRGVAERLAGRAFFLDLEGFCLAELARPDAGSSWHR